MPPPTSPLASTPVIAGTQTKRWPRRHVIVALTFFASLISYTDRVNISVAAVTMKEQFGWSQTEKGFVLSSFYIGYMVFLLASGWLATRFGGKRVLGFAVLAWSVFTLLTPFAAGVSMVVLIATRIAMGIGEAGMYPASYEMFGRWVPYNERARAVSRLLSGIPIGTVLGLLATGWIVSRYGWPMAFYTFGAIGLLWVVAWFRQVRNDPAADSRVTTEERALLPAAVPQTRSIGEVPWRRLLLRVPTLAIVVAHFATTWCLYVLLSWLPSYFRDVQHLSIANAGLFSAAPWVAMFAVTMIAGSVSDRMIEHGWSVTSTRKVMQCTGLLVSAAFLLAMRDVHSPTVALAMLCGATGALGCTWCGYAPSLIDVAPRFSALLGGFSNTVATIPGIVGVAVTGWLVDVTGTYSVAFVLTAILSTAGALVFGVCFNARPLVE